MRLAVSGASGFIGHHVVAELERCGVSPVLLVRPGSLSPGPSSGRHLVSCDIAEPVGDLFERMGRPDVLIHLAWAGLPNFTSPHHLENELPGQERFLTSLVTAGLGQIVSAGTCFEYGQQSGALDESMEPEPSNPYGQAKDGLRRSLVALQSTSPFALTWGRLFYMYGKGQAKSSLFSQLSAAMDAGRGDFDMSGGEQVRDFLPVETVAAHIVALALSGRSDGVVNICSGKPITVRAQVERWMDERGAALKLNLGVYPYPTYEPMSFWGDRTKLDRCLAAS